MEIISKRLERVDLIKVQGRVDQNNSPELEQALRSILDDGRHNIVVDMSEVSYISSAGLKTLQAAARSAREALLGGDLRVAALPSHVKDIFDTIGFTQLFKVYADPLEAVGSF